MLTTTCSCHFQSVQDEQSRKVLYLLTLVTSVFVPLQFLTGLWGMNFVEVGCFLLGSGSILLPPSSFFFVLSIFLFSCVRRYRLLKGTDLFFSDALLVVLLSRCPC